MWNERSLEIARGIPQEKPVGMPLWRDAAGVPQAKIKDSIADPLAVAQRSLEVPTDKEGISTVRHSSECCHLFTPTPSCTGSSTRCLSSSENLDEDSLTAALEQDLTALSRSGSEAVSATPVLMKRRSFVRRESHGASEHHDAVPCDPVAASIFDEFTTLDDIDLPPAPAWLSCEPTLLSRASSRKGSLNTEEWQLETPPKSLQMHDSPVILHVYELSEWTRLSGLPIFHLGVEVFRCEYYFSRDGISLCPPAHHRGHIYKEAVLLGTPSISRREWRRALGILKSEWPPGSYERIGCNCQDFAIAVCKVLGLYGNLPAKYCRCAELDQILPPSVMSASGVVTKALRNWVPDPCGILPCGSIPRVKAEAIPIGPEVCKSRLSVGVRNAARGNDQIRHQADGVEKLVCGDGARNRVVYII